MIFSFISVFGFLAPGHCTYPPRSTRRSRAKFQGELAYGGQKEPGPNPEAFSLAPPPLPTKMSMSRAVHVLMSEGHGKLLASTPGYFRLLCSTTGTRGSSFKPPTAETAVPACHNFARFGPVWATGKSTHPKEPQNVYYPLTIAQAHAQSYAKPEPVEQPMPGFASTVVPS